MHYYQTPTTKNDGILYIVSFIDVLLLGFIIYLNLTVGLSLTFIVLTVMLLLAKYEERTGS
jgi:hypothetical protein